ncbi:hypothetical protein QM996_26645 (plasmid) [Sinorhizobium chiapasense]|uniref:hypothetical protein n=1 Tax=Sinorhizobium chiapasense TaxID=501572 RepID=UPI002FE3BEB9
MIGQTAVTYGGRSVAATISTAAIAATVAAKDDAGIAGSIVFAPFAIRLTLGAASNPEQSRYRRDANHNNPENYLAQILAPSAVDTLKGNQR